MKVKLSSNITLKQLFSQLTAAAAFLTHFNQNLNTSSKTKTKPVLSKQNNFMPNQPKLTIPNIVAEEDKVNSVCIKKIYGINS